MSVASFLSLLTQALYLAVFVAVLIKAVRRPLRTNIDIALLFGAVAAVITAGLITDLLRATPGRAESVFAGAGIMALPYLLLRLLDDFAYVPRWLMRLAAAGLVLSVLVLISAPSPLPGPLTLLLVAYFVLLEGYDAMSFAGAARGSRGVTRRRMQAVAAGSLLLGGNILLAGFAAAFPGWSGFWQSLGSVLGLLSGLIYFAGFAPLNLLRRAWQEPELRDFLSQAAVLPRLPDTAAIVHELERGAARSIGAPGATIGLWQPEEAMLRFNLPPNFTPGDLSDPADGSAETPGYTLLDGAVGIRPPHTVGGRTFASQQPVFIPDTVVVDRTYAGLYRAFGAHAALCAPITSGDHRLGVLCVFAPRAPIFGDDDLQLVTLLADQAAVILESRALIDEATRVRAREEATRLKDDFLSAAAHDLKTPLTTLIGQAQLLERRATRRPDAPADLAGIQRIVREGQRLRQLVLELLDAARTETGRLVGARRPADLAAFAREVCDRGRVGMQRCDVDAPGPVIAEVDANRILQLLENLVENGLKYSPSGGPVRVRVWSDPDRAEALLSVSDEGIGIPAADLPFIFERFHRGQNVDDRRYAGMGLGLYICRGIAEQHGGSISVVSTPGKGTTFTVRLPQHAPEQVHTSETRAVDPSAPPAVDHDPRADAALVS